ncbi:hypothetical protein B0T19DRAFT_208287 [Cercophora scortea]|uniref:Uncharacterized protein n=1 Tax=Cercophora scortea TaxID=314031 RepID=A0AAE0IED9_9PEZI|nr:hypothetical protein B0T19DRAFT_208287 [Cercophora scortea]
MQGLQGLQLIVVSIVTVTAGYVGFGCGTQKKTRRLFFVCLSVVDLCVVHPESSLGGLAIHTTRESTQLVRCYTSPPNEENHGLRGQQARPKTAKSWFLPRTDRGTTRRRGKREKRVRAFGVDSMRLDFGDARRRIRSDQIILFFLDSVKLRYFHTRMVLPSSGI